MPHTKKQKKHFYIPPTFLFGCSHAGVCAYRPRCRFLANGPPPPEKAASRGRTLGGAAPSTTAEGATAGRDAAVARSLSSDSTGAAAADDDAATAADEPGRNSKRDASSKASPQLSPETIKRRRESERAKRLARFANPKKVTLLFF